MKRVWSLLLASMPLGCGSADDAPADAANGGPSAPPQDSSNAVPSQTAVSDEQTGEPMRSGQLRATVYVFSKIVDQEPSNITVMGTTSAVSCELIIPGSTPMTEGSVETTPTCTGNTEQMLVDVRYPASPPPAVEPDASLIPSMIETASPDIDCSASRCTATGVEPFDAAPPFPHVRVDIVSAADERVEFTVLGNSRMAAATVELLSPAVSYSVVYLSAEAN